MCYLLMVVRQLVRLLEGEGPWRKSTTNRDVSLDDVSNHLFG
jgi:hypothetical protein